MAGLFLSRGGGGNYNDFVIASSLYLITTQCLILLRFLLFVLF